LFAAEVVVESALADSRIATNVIHAGSIVAIVGKTSQRGFEQVVAGFFAAGLHGFPLKKYRLVGMYFTGKDWDCQASAERFF
jgi:hypothetical protein